MLTLSPKEKTGPVISKYISLRGSYSQNKADPWKNSSLKVPYSPLEETEAQTLTLASTYKTVPTVSRDVSPRDIYGQNIADSWTNSSGEENKAINTHTNLPLNTQTLIQSLMEKQALPRHYHGCWS